MIHCIVGFPGTGKTTAAARMAVKAIRKGIKVYSNIPELTQTIPITLSDFGKFKIHDGLVLFDEAGLPLRGFSLA